METITLTFGDCAENHKGMQEIGERASVGMTLADLQLAKVFFERAGVDCDLVNLAELGGGEATDEKFPDAYILVAKKGCAAMVDVAELTAEQNTLERDKKAFMYGRVVNKKARHNLCFSDFDQAPDYENKKGTVVNFSKLPVLSRVRSLLPTIVGEKVDKLQCEANYYYDVRSTFIGFHGDTERKIVVAIRLGADFPLHYQWFKQSKPVGKLFTRMLTNGDVYFMSEKAVGSDWKKKKIYTLRHAAGTAKKVVSWL